MKTVLPIDDMDKRHAGLTPGVAGAYYEAACVSLSRNHSPPQDFDIVRDSTQVTAEVKWMPPDARRSAAWANQSDATRDGAYACAIAAAEVTCDMVAVGRAETLTGADYYIAPRGFGIRDFENCTRLEVSGTHCDASEVRRRLNDKVQQARQGQSPLPAIAVVVGFRVRSIMLRSVDHELD